MSRERVRGNFLSGKKNQVWQFLEAWSSNPSASCIDYISIFDFDKWYSLNQTIYVKIYIFINFHIIIRYLLVKRCVQFMKTIFEQNVMKMKSKIMYIYSRLNVFFRQIKSFIRFRLAFVFRLQTLSLINFSIIYQSGAQKLRLDKIL